MYTVKETQEFQKQADALWSEDDRLAFVSWISANPLAGVVIPGSGGTRKVRWTVSGKGKRGGVRVIYFNLTSDEVVLLIAIYAKTQQSNITAKAIRKA
jgi:mRNA-degrading endonuclease RelE of RelBE toxin-antitoxin system